MRTGEIHNLIAQGRVVPVAVLPVPQDDTAGASGDDGQRHNVHEDDRRGAIPWEQANWRITKAPAKIVPIRS
jgi:hypothetical protein